MKKFSEQQIKQFIKDFLLVHVPIGHYTLSDRSNTYTYRKKRSNSPFTSCIIRDTNLKNVKLPLEQFKRLTNPNNKSEVYYFLPCYIDGSQYSGTPEQERILLEWAHDSEKLMELYFLPEKERQDNYIALMDKVEEGLVEKARQLWNTITYETIGYDKLSDVCAVTFWRLYKTAYDSQFFYKEDDSIKEKFKNFEKEIFSLFENHEDILKLEQLIHDDPHSTKSTAQYDMWKALMKKHVPHNSLKEMTPIIKETYDYLNTKKNQLASETIVNGLRLLQYCEYSSVKDVFTYYHVNNKTKAITELTNKVLNKYEPKNYSENMSLITDVQYKLVHESKAKVDLSLVKRFLSDNLALERVFNILIKNYMQNEGSENNNIELSYKFSADNLFAYFGLRSSSEDKCTEFQKKLEQYIKVAVSPEFLTKENLEMASSRYYAGYYNQAAEDTPEAKLYKIFNSTRMMKKLNNTLDDDIFAIRKTRKI